MSSSASACSVSRLRIRKRQGPAGGGRPREVAVGVPGVQLTVTSFARRQLRTKRRRSFPEDCMPRSMSFPGLQRELPVPALDTG